MSVSDNSALNSLALDHGAGTPLYLQIYEQVREFILAGRLGAGTRLPSTRSLAAELEVSRTTTLAAYDQLASEGYLEGQPGSGAYVAPELPDALLTVSSPPATQPEPEPHQETTTDPDDVPRPFDPGLPDTGTFAFAEWSRCLARSWRSPSADMLHQAVASGAPELRSAIARHIKSVRGITCSPEQIFITTGAAESISIVAGAILQPGDTVLLEDPSYPVAYRALQLAGMRTEAVRVDEDGFQLANARGAGKKACAALITPSRQYPLGMTLSLSRRLELLSWAHRADAWVVEDDYDSEYRYKGRPLEPLMNLDGDGRVIYLGSFSKIMFRSLRLGYVIVPTALIGRVRRHIHEHPPQASLVPQGALAEFIASGQLAQHVRRMRRVYAERCRCLQEIVAIDLGAYLNAPHSDAGMHMTAFLNDAVARQTDDVSLAARGTARNMTLTPLSTHYRGPGARQGLLLGFAAFEPASLKAAGRKLADLLDEAAPDR